MIRMQLFNQFIDRIFSNHSNSNQELGTEHNPCQNEQNTSQISKVTTNLREYLTVYTNHKTSSANIAISNSEPEPEANVNSVVNSSSSDLSQSSFNEITYSIPIPIKTMDPPSYVNQPFYHPSVLYQYKIINYLDSIPCSSNNNSGDISPCVYSTLLVDNI